MALTLPYPDLDFVPLDILTADEMNQIVANYTYISNQFPIGSQNIDFTTFVPDWTLLNSTYGLRYRKVGAMVEVDISAYSDSGLALTSGISVDLGTLPAAYRPRRSYRFPVWGYRSSSSTSQMLSVNVQSSGVVQLVYWGAGGTYQQIGGHGTFAV